MEDGAYCAAAWAGGQKQIDIARSMGMKHSSTVCLAIGKFVDEWSGTLVRSASLDLYPNRRSLGRGQICDRERKALVPLALVRFIAARQAPRC
jgi:hypothetical protein